MAPEVKLYLRVDVGENGPWVSPRQIDPAFSAFRNIFPSSMNLATLVIRPHRPSRSAETPARLPSWRGATDTIRLRVARTPRTDGRALQAVE